MVMMISTRNARAVMVAVSMFASLEVRIGLLLLHAAAARPAADPEHYPAEAGHPGGIAGTQRLAGLGIPFGPVEQDIADAVNKIGQYGDALIQQPGAVQILLRLPADHPLEPARAMPAQAKQSYQADQGKPQQLYRQALDHPGQGQQSHREGANAEEHGDHPGNEELGNQ